MKKFVVEKWALIGYSSDCNHVILPISFAHSSSLSPKGLNWGEFTVAVVDNVSRRFACLP
jgi:hypothetical protein